MPQATVTMRKLGGTLNIAEAPSPTQTDATLITAENAMASDGRGVSMIPVAAGVTNSANNSSVPTACTAIVTASASSTMNTTESARTGTPFASATGALIELYSNGR